MASDRGLGVGFLGAGSLNRLHHMPNAAGLERKCYAGRECEGWARGYAERISVGSIFCICNGRKRRRFAPAGLRLIITPAGSV